MTIANTSLNDSFDLWRARKNQMAYIINLLTEGSMNTTGTITLTNPTFLNGNVSLNVSNGSIRVKANTFDANAIALVSNSATLTITGTGQLGTTIYFNIGTLSTTVNDASAANIASALSVNTAHVHARSAFDKANAVDVIATTAGTTAVAAFTKANTAFANTTGTFEGALTVKGNLIPQGNLTPQNYVSHGSANVVTQTLVDNVTAIAWDTALGQIAEIQLVGNRAMAGPTNIKKGYYTLFLRQDGVGGRTLTWNGALYKWPANVAPVLSTAPNANDIITFVSHDGVRLYGTYVANVC